MNVLIVEILSNQNQELLNGINLINKRIDNLYFFHEITSISGTPLEYLIAGVIIGLFGLLLWKKPCPYFP